MTELASVELPDLGTARLQVIDADYVRLSGTIATQNPTALLAPCFKRLHEATMSAGHKRLTVDVTALTFVNSSSIRLFIDWAMWIRAADPSKRYTLNFVTHRDITWQSTSFTALKMIAGDVVVTEERGG